MDKTFSKSLDEMGYQRNKYNWCVIRLSKKIDALYSVMLKFWKCCMSITTLSLLLSLTSRQNMEIFQRWPSHVVSSINTSGKPSTNHLQVKLISPWSIKLEICFIIYHYTWKMNRQHWTDTNSLILLMMRPSYPKPTHIFFNILWHNYYTCRSNRNQTYHWQFPSYVI